MAEAVNVDLREANRASPVSSGAVSGWHSCARPPAESGLYEIMLRFAEEDSKTIVRSQYIVGEGWTLKTFAVMPYDKWREIPR